MFTHTHCHSEFLQWVLVALIKMVWDRDPVEPNKKVVGAGVFSLMWVGAGQRKAMFINTEVYWAYSGAYVALLKCLPHLI